MKETLAYDLLTVMQEKKGKALTADGRKGEFSEQYYDYRGVHKRVCDLVANGCAMRAGATDDGLLLYKVSEKGLCIKSFDDYKKVTYKPRTPKPKKTREESNCKKESKLYPTGYETTKEDLLANPSDHPSGIYYDTETGEEIVVKKECKMIGDESKPVFYGSMGIGSDAGTQITTTHRNEEGDIVIGYKVNTQVTEEEHKAKETREQEERERLHRVLGKKLQPRYKRLRSAFTGK